jgi:hypothetical protein
VTTTTGAAAPPAHVAREPGVGWEAVVSAALVGTDRRPVPATGLDPVLDASLADRPPDAALLGAAAALAAHRRAGFLPPWRPPPPAPAARDDRPAVPAGALQLLALLLDGHVAVAGATDELVAEWLDRAARGGWRVPRGWHVALLDLASRRPERRAAVAALVGPSATWLGERNPVWAWAALRSPSVDPAAFALATRAERRALLARVRADDPAAGRALLASTWERSPAAERAELLQVLETGLGPDDEPTLEAALDDRAASVRTVAAALLDRLPTSARAGRMATRLAPLVRVTGRLRRSLVVDRPGEPDAAARRDGIVDPPPGQAGERATWLVQLIAATPLGWWTTHLALPAADVVALGADEPELLLGWQHAAQAQRDATWAALLAAVVPTPELLALLDPVAAERVATTALRGAKTAAAVARLAVALPGPWSPATSALVLARLQAVDSTVALRVAAPALAGRLDPSLAGDVAEWVPTADPAGADLLRGVHHALTIRASLDQELP